MIAASPFSGEGYRKVWARLRAQCVRTAPRRVLRVMKANDLLAPPRPVQRDTHPHDGTIVTDRVDDVWGTDMTQTVTTGEGRAYVFIAADHCSGEFIGTHASSSASRWEALEPVRQGVTSHFGGVGPDVAKGLTLRHDLLQLPTPTLSPWRQTTCHGLLAEKRRNSTRSTGAKSSSIYAISCPRDGE
ncbi:IS3 family transposase [Roseovarius sp. A46]|uniref:IS3 family transposase n=1 Tax=Roseovarius sp. A46 TaxID=2109331 RepID=UPI00101115CE|nr:IS3 family transposase [Roseovarius sp. A46]